MKKLLILPLLFFLGLTTQAQEMPWPKDITQAQALAQKQERPILMIFSGSDWCKPCMLLKKEILESPEFKTYAAEHLVLLELDFPARKKNKLSEKQTRHNEALAEQYNSKGIFPSMILLDDDEKMLGTLDYNNTWTALDYINQLKNKIAHEK